VLLIVGYAASFVLVYGLMTHGDPFAPTPARMHTLFRRISFDEDVQLALTMRTYAPLFALCQAFPAVDVFVYDRGYQIYWTFFSTGP
jgi:hypothetical protein